MQLLVVFLVVLKVQQRQRFSKSMMSSVSNGSLTVDYWIAASVHCKANWSGILVNSDFSSTSKDTSLQLSGICSVLIASIMICAVQLPVELHPSC